MATVRTIYGVTSKFEHKGEILRIKVVHIKGNLVDCVIMRNNEVLIEHEVFATDVTEVLRFLDNCNIALSAFRKVTGFNDDNALGEVVGAIRSFLR